MSHYRRQKFNRFYLTTNIRRRRNRITKVQNDRGEWIHSARGVEDHICEHFRSVFKAKGENLNDILRQIIQDMNTNFKREVTDGEIRGAGFQLGMAKALGPEGFPGLFYQTSWHTISPDGITAVKSFIR